MAKKIHVLIAARTDQALETIQASVSEMAGAELFARVTTNGHVDPLAGLEFDPDVLVLELGEKWQAQLDSLASVPLEKRPILLVVGDVTNTDLVRHAMRLGARDVFKPPLDGEEVAQAIATYVREKRHALKVSNQGEVIGFFGARGGVGTTFLASNVAWLIASESDRKTVLVDTDIRFGNAALTLDVTPGSGWVDIASAYKGMDRLALRGFTNTHPCGMKLIGPNDEDFRAKEDVPPAAVRQVVTIAAESFDQVLVDLPHVINPNTVAAMECCDKIYVVTEQTVAAIRDARRLSDFLRQQLGFESGRVNFIVNRYAPKSQITLKDIEDIVPNAQLVTIPSDYRRVSAAESLGISVVQHARSAPVSKAIKGIVNHLFRDPSKPTSFLGWLFSSRQGEEIKLEPRIGG